MTVTAYKWPAEWLKPGHEQPTDDPDEFEAALIDDQDVQLDEMGAPVVEWAQCGACLRWWNDAAISYLTPTPSARCPFEYEHDDD